jgi:alpha-glucuronidase
LQQPYASIRWVNQWDNLDGRIERGYGGTSIFFENGAVCADLTRAGEYARLLASIGINGCNLNNVNADPRIFDDKFLPQLARIADVFRPSGVRIPLLWISAARRRLADSILSILWIRMSPNGGGISLTGSISSFPIWPEW